MALALRYVSLVESSSVLYRAPSDSVLALPTYKATLAIISGHCFVVYNNFPYNGHV